MVGADGRVLKVTEVESPAGESADAYSIAAIQAMKKWVFDTLPAGEPPRERTYRTVMGFGKRVPRRVFPISHAQLEARLPNLLREAFPAVIALPGLGGYVVHGTPTQSGSIRAVIGAAIRAGPQPDGVSSWVVASWMAVLTRTGDDACPCSWLVSRPEAADSFMTWLSGKLNAVQSERSPLAPIFDEIVPSGLPEPEAAGTWNVDTIQEWMRTALLSGPEAAATNASATQPDEAAFSRRSEEPADGTGCAPSSSSTPPKRIKKTFVAYPENARRARLQGKVLLKARIGTSGDIESVRVLNGHALLDQAAIDAVCCWKYEPATEGGKPVATDFNMVIEFNLD